MEHKEGKGMVRRRGEWWRVWRRPLGLCLSLWNL